LVHLRHVLAALTAHFHPEGFSVERGEFLLNGYMRAEWSRSRLLGKLVEGTFFRLLLTHALTYFSRFVFLQVQVSRGSYPTFIPYPEGTEQVAVVTGCNAGQRLREVQGFPWGDSDLQRNKPPTTGNA
jgi:hypothetical protein